MPSSISIRKVTESDDAAQLATVINRSFADLESKTGFVEDLANFDICFGLVKAVQKHGVVAIDDETNEFVGVCFLSPYEETHPEIRAVDPIGVLPDYQSRGVGKKLMEAVIELGRSIGTKHIRLAVDAYNNKSYSLYSRLGFEVKEVLSLIAPTTRVQLDTLTAQENNPLYTVRKMTLQDVDSVISLMTRVAGFARPWQLHSYIDASLLPTAHPAESPYVLVSNDSVDGANKIVAFSLGFHVAAWSVAETEAQWKQLTAHQIASIYQPNKSVDSVDFFTSIVVPVDRSPKLFHWLLRSGFAVTKNMFGMCLSLTDAADDTNSSYVYRYDGVYFPGVDY